MGSKRDILAKADLVVADLVGEGGFMLPKQAAKFIKRLSEEATVMPLSTVATMPSPQFPIETIGFGERVLRAGAERTALPESERSRPTMTKVDLDAKLFKAEVRISYEALEDNIEQAGLQNTIMGLLTERVAFDMDEIAVIADTASGTPVLAQFDGLLKAATSHVVDGAGQKLDPDFLRDMLKAMPNKWLRDKTKFRYLTGIDADQDYRHGLIQRATVVGDDNLLKDVPAMYNGIALTPAAAFPETLSPGTYTNVLLTDPKNIVFGIWRKIRIETDRDITSGELIIVVSLRYDVKYAIEDAVVKGINIDVA